jgi:hypothetical protein
MSGLVAGGQVVQYHHLTYADGGNLVGHIKTLRGPHDSGMIFAKSEYYMERIKTGQYSPYYRVDRIIIKLLHWLWHYVRHSHTTEFNDLCV